MSRYKPGDLVMYRNRLYTVTTVKVRSTDTIYYHINGWDSVSKYYSIPEKRLDQLLI